MKYELKKGDKVRIVRNHGAPNATVSCGGTIVGFSKWKVLGSRVKQPTVLVEKPWGEVEEIPVSWVRSAL